MLPFAPGQPSRHGMRNAIMRPSWVSAMLKCLRNTNMYPQRQCVPIETVGCWRGRLQAACCWGRSRQWWAWSEIQTMSTYAANREDWDQTHSPMPTAMLSDCVTPTQPTHLSLAIVNVTSVDNRAVRLVRNGLTEKNDLCETIVSWKMMRSPYLCYSMYASYEKLYDVLAKQFGGFFEHASRWKGTLASLGFTIRFTRIRFTLESLLCRIV